MGVRRLAAVLVIAASLLFTTGANMLPLVPVVFMRDEGPDLLYWRRVPARPSTFFCLGYPKRSKTHPITLKCLSVVLPGNVVRWDLYNYHPPEDV